MKTLKYQVTLLLTIMAIAVCQAQPSNAEKPTIIFVHGIWADGSSFSSQIAALQAKGYPVYSVQNPISSLTDDVAATQRAIKLAKGKVILVGHSWGGFVISQAGNDPKVEGMVFLAAFAPDLGETVPALSKNAAETELKKYFIPVDGFVYLSEPGVKSVFAPDLSSKQRALIFATQTPASHTVFQDKSGSPAWKNKPTWFAIAQNDQVINPDLERFMAKRMKAKTVELASSHVEMLSRPKEVLKLIEEAANFKY